MAESNTKICNQALSKIGAKRINNLEDKTENTPPAIQCRLHFEPTRDALIRSYPWRFASARKVLSQDTKTPDFEWAFQYHLPSDFMAMKSIFEDRFTENNFRNYVLEDDLLLTDETEMSIRYVKRVIDASKFDPLFVEVFVLQLGLKLVSLAGATPKIRESLKDDLKFLMPAVRALDGQETNTAGRAESRTWNDARFGNNAGFPMRF